MNGASVTEYVRCGHFSSRKVCPKCFEHLLAAARRARELLHASPENELEALNVLTVAISAVEPTTDTKGVER